ncbi:MAG TPA: CinA family nicotinamide mononucleotide deamidase-related protein, partial [Puia sp.]|nr:CinA family nicotinamide mononucleotide deamidase-related protein [Puia sp.]
MEKIVAGIITIGDELLIGQVVDTNSAWMAQELNRIGIWVARRTAVGDTADDIRQALDEESRRAQIILITGGLGPTADDITKPLLAEYFGGRMIMDAGALENVRSIFSRLQRPMIDRNLRQAEVPDTCTVIPNRQGTAPGMWFERDSRIFVAMPGVPHEMKGMMSAEIIPRLLARFSLPFIAHRTLLLAGVGESFLSEHLASFEAGLPATVRLAYLPNFGMLRLRLTIRGGDPERSATTLDSLFAALRQEVKDWLVTDQDIPIAEAVGRLLKVQGKTLATAESCTGGYIAHLITSIPGSSQYFKGSVVSYANEIKSGLLDVSPEVLASEGAVSLATVEAMVKGALGRL